MASVLLTAACGAGAAAPAGSSAPVASSPAKPSAASSGGFQAEWTSLAAAAKQEGTLAIGFTANPPLKDQILPEFQKQFGVNVQVTEGAGNQIVNRLIQEKTAGVHSLDVYISATSATATGVDANIYAPLKPQLILPDMADSSKWVGGKPWWFDKGETYVLRLDRQLRYFFAANSQSVDVSQFKSPQDLLDPKWKGKIAAIDPLTPSAGQSIAADILKIMGPDYLKKLYVDQNVKYTTDQRVLGNWIGQNAYPIGIALPLDEMASMKDTGLKVARMRIDNPAMASTTSVLYYGIVDKAQHPNAAKLLANWLLMKDTMQLIVNTEGYVVTRNDVDYAKLDADNRPSQGGDYFDEGTYDYISGQKEQLVKQIGDLLKH
ncbi:MAG TPA: extracellular solute-binding protein [Chloroflexota bacterium]